ncbi:MAG: Gfo/Idh/MocA family oxidoreductase [Spirochaetales bacterium]|nr:Gfo/Idh/MocA family oxidoreductase [Spirochaetales bacterium]
MTERMNIGIIGSGYMGSMHANILNDLPFVNLAGITAKTMQRASGVSKQFNIRLYKNYHEMIKDGGISIADICTPTDTHAQIAIDCLRAGKHVILEFPACGNLDELEQIIKESQKNEKLCVVAYYSRYQSQYKYIFDLALTGRIGKITSLHISRSSSKIFSSEDIINNLISQDIDFMVNLLGSPRSFSCSSPNKDMAALTFIYKDSMAVIYGTTNMHPNYPFTSRHIISGENGCIDLHWRYTDHPEYKMQFSSRVGMEEIRNTDYDPYKYELEKLIKGIQAGNVKGMDIDSIYDSSKLAYECRDMKE